MGVPRAKVPYDLFAEAGGSGSSLAWIDVTDFNADPTGTLDSTAAIVAAIASAAGAPCVIYLPAGTYRVTDEVLIDKDRTHIVGDGQQTSTINFVPTSGGKAALHFYKSSGVLTQCSARGLSVNSSDTTYQKFGIKVTDASVFALDDFATYPFTGGAAISPFTGGSSAGVVLKGREIISVRNVTINADIPIWIDGNPASTIDIDHAHFQGLYLLAGGTNPDVYISTGVNLSNVTFDGAQAWVTGGRALYWVDTTSTIPSHNFRLENIRYEQPTARNYAFQIEHNYVLTDFAMRNCIFGSALTCDGVKLRKVRYPRLSEVTYNGTGVALDVDTTAFSVDIDNVFFQDTSTITMGGLVKLESRGTFSSQAPVARYEYWIDPANASYGAGRGREFGALQYEWPATGTLASGASVSIPSFGGGINHATVRIRYKGATKRGSWTVFYDTTGAVIESTTAAGDTSIGNVAGDLCVLWSSAASVVLLNNLGETISYSMQVAII